MPLTRRARRSLTRTPLAGRPEPGDGAPPLGGRHHVPPRSPHEVFHERAVERLVGDEPLQPPILLLKLGQAVRLLELEAAVLRPPALQRVLRGPMVAADLNGFPASASRTMPTVCSSVNRLVRMAPCRSWPVRSHDRCSSGRGRSRAGLQLAIPMARSKATNWGNGLG